MTRINALQMNIQILKLQVIYCQECKISMCNKCEKIHPLICIYHHIYKLDKNINEIFTGFCKEKNHKTELCCTEMYNKNKR